MKRNQFLSWVIFISLCFIWGSSFILMKKGLYTDENTPVLTAYQVAAIRILSAGIILLPVLFSEVKKISMNKIFPMILSGLLGSFFPAFLFCIAETKIDSALAGTLNSLTPIFVIITGFLFFNIYAGAKKIAGVMIGLLGCILLFFTNKHSDLGYLIFTLLIVLATIMYGINVNMVQRNLKSVSSIQIAAVAFCSLIIPSLFVLIYTGYFNLPLLKKEFVIATGAASILGVVGTAVASIIFYMLVKRAGGLFASLVTYCIPFVAIGWGLLDHENITLLQVGCLLIILLGVYLANRSEKKNAEE